MKSYHYYLLLFGLAHEIVVVVVHIKVGARGGLLGGVGLHLRLVAHLVRLVLVLVHGLGLCVQLLPALARLLGHLCEFDARDLLHDLGAVVIGEDQVGGHWRLGRVGVLLGLFFLAPGSPLALAPLALGLPLDALRFLLLPTWALSWPSWASSHRCRHWHPTRCRYHHCLRCGPLACLVVVILAASSSSSPTLLHPCPRTYLRPSSGRGPCPSPCRPRC